MNTEKKVSPAMARLLEIKKEYSEYLIFYRMGDFYELFFDDALVASKALNITLTKRGKIDNVDIPMCGVPFHAYENYLARLIDKGYKVAICEQIEDPKEAKKRGAGSIVQREVVRLVTAGTITEDCLLNASRNNYLFCAVQNGKSFGFAWLDMSTGEFYTQEIGYRPETEVADLRSVLMRLEPGEILVSNELLQKPDLFHLFNEYKEKLSVLPQARFKYDSAVKNLTEFYQVETLDAFGFFSKAEVISAGIILDYVRNTQKSLMPRISAPSKVLTGKYMEIDGSTRANLDLIEGMKGTTLISIIDRTVTAAGGRRLRSQLMNPLLDIKTINERYDAIEFFIKHEDLRNRLREFMKSIPDAERSISRLSSGQQKPRDLYAVLLVLQALPHLKNMIYNCEDKDLVNENMPSAITDILNKIGQHLQLVNNLSRAIVSEDDEESELPAHVRDGGIIKKGYNATLDAQRDLRDRGKLYIRDLEEKYLKETGIDGLKIRNNNLIGYYVEVSNKYTTQLLSNPLFIHRQSVLNAARFTTVELTELENNIRSATERALQTEIEIFDSLTSDVLAEADDIIRDAQALAQIDVAASVAELAVEKNYCRPLLDESTDFEVIEGRHPIVECALQVDKNGSFVSNDCRLNGENNRIWLMTGPNMAGKSTFLRQNAIIAILAQMGCYVPAKSARIGIINKVFSRVGASDDLSRGRSTFMVEMIETAAILNRSDSRSFVILDEIGRGTATFDGLSIAWAVVEYLHNTNKCRALFATHYHELVAQAQNLPALSLHCMKTKEFKDQVIFMHEVVEGSVDRSYGIHVAKLAGLPPAVIKRADQILRTIEKENLCKDSIKRIDELPLFSYREETTNVADYSHIAEALRQINPDELTAREALQKIYDLKELLNEE